jgi:hypothetical protein
MKPQDVVVLCTDRKADSNLTAIAEGHDATGEL